jgi:hypothetical protein
MCLEVSESRRWDSNPRPIPYKGIALPAELLRRHAHRRRCRGGPDRTRPSRYVCDADNIEHPKDIGDRSTLAIIAALQENGFATYLPFGENTRCDVVIDRDGVVSRVQCKTGRLRRGAVIFPVCSSYAHHPNPRMARRDYRGQVDFFAIFCRETTVVYLVPIDVLPLTREAALRVDPARNNQRSRIRLAADYEIGRVAIERLRGPSDAR